MRLKLFRAPNIAAAMARVRSDLGPEALILSTRRVADGVEITAALEPRPDYGAPANTQPQPQPSSAPGRAQLLRWHGVPALLAARLDGGPLATLLNAVLPFRSLDIGPASNPLLLVGPPGAGKTLTAARLATRLVMAGVTPLVVTADGRRAGATEQLAAFTRILGLTLTVASQPAALCKALTRRQESMPVLIDGPGFDPFDPCQREELAALATAASATVVLVLAAGLDPSEAEDLAAAFLALGATMLIITRLDLTRRMGGVLAAASAGLALVEAGVGPGAADGLTPLTPALLASRLTMPPSLSQTTQDAP